MILSTAVKQFLFTPAFAFDLNNSIGFRKNKCLRLLVDFEQQKPYMYIAALFRMRRQPDISCSSSVSITPLMNYRKWLLRMPTLVFNLCYINHLIAISLSLADFRLLHTNFSVPVNFSQPWRFFASLYSSIIWGGQLISIGSKEMFI